MAPRQQQDWGLTREGLERLLARLDPDREVAGREYERLRRKLAEFFMWRGSPFPEGHADETLDRVARNLERGVEIGRLTQYAAGVARLVFLESHKRRERERTAATAWGSAVARAERSDETEEHLACMERCLSELPEENRTLIVAYYDEVTASSLDGRKRLAERLGIHYVTLRTRAHRVRTGLEECLSRCVQKQSAGNK